MVPIFNAEGVFISVLSYSHPIGYTKPDRTFEFDFAISVWNYIFPDVDFFIR